MEKFLVAAFLLSGLLLSGCVTINVPLLPSPPVIVGSNPTSTPEKTYLTPKLPKNFEYYAEVEIDLVFLSKAEGSRHSYSFRVLDNEGNLIPFYNLGDQGTELVNQIDGEATAEEDSGVPDFFAEWRSFHFGYGPVPFDGAGAWHDYLEVSKPTLELTAGGEIHLLEVIAQGSFTADPFINEFGHVTYSGKDPNSESWMIELP